MKNPSLVPIRRVAAFAAACALFSGAVTQAQPTLTSIYPDGTIQFQPTNTLAFSLFSSATIPAANISVQLAATNLSGSGSRVTLTSGNGLTVTGPAATPTVTTPLTSNMVYIATIVASDSTGDLTNIVTFDTIIPSYTWEAEDFDYGGGKFIDNPQTNAYSGLVATINVDAFNPNGGSAAYRPINTGDDTGGDLGNETCGDTPRAEYLNTGFVDYDQGWNTGGSGLWGNFTRHYPAGKWNVFMRASSWATSKQAAFLYQGGPNGTLMGRFGLPNTSTTDNTYQIYTWSALTDIAGNLIEFDTDGSQKTLTLVIGDGSYNANFFLLMPVDPNYKPKPFVSGVTPDGSQMFAYTNLFSFTANSVPGITVDNVQVSLNGIKPSGLTIGGSPHVLKGSFPLTSNVVYSIVITLTDANGTTTYNTIVGTFTTNNYTFEAEDFDFNNGQYYENPQVDSYAGLLGVDGVDAHNTSTSVGTAYRPADPGVLGNEGCGDQKRTQFANTNDYDIGWTASGNWGNYTRTYPAGVFNVIMRGASPSGQTDGASLLRVTSGVGTSTQTTTPLGRFNFPLTGGWQTWAWLTMVDSQGNPAIVTNSGAVSTFRLSQDNGGWNGNFLMLVPADTVRPIISHLSPDGTAMFQRTNTMSFTVTSTAGIDTNSLVVTLNGAPVPNLAISGSATNLNVSYANLQPDTAYTATIAVNSTNNDPAFVTYSFDTFSSSYYTIEAEDFDYNGGQFYDNPQLDSYMLLFGTDGIDAHNDSGGSTAYRSNDLGDLGNEVNGDLPRAQFVSAGTNDYDIGWTAAGQWANYTRTYPKGSFNVYLRVSSPSGQADGASLLRVTSGVGTSNQTTNGLGTFNFPATGGWQTYGWAPLVDASGNPVVVTNSGSVSTFRLAQDNSGWNANFLMFVPVTPAGPRLTVAVSGAKLTLSFPTQSGATYQIEYKNTLADPSWTALGSPVTGTGAVMSVQDSLTGTARFYRARITGL